MDWLAELIAVFAFFIGWCLGLGLGFVLLEI
jgi:hypothetical protein